MLYSIRKSVQFCSLNKYQFSKIVLTTVKEEEELPPATAVSMSSHIVSGCCSTKLMICEDKETAVAWDSSYSTLHTPRYSYQRITTYMYVFRLTQKTHIITVRCARVCHPANKNARMKIVNTLKTSWQLPLSSYHTPLNSFSWQYCHIMYSTQ